MSHKMSRSESLELVNMFDYVAKGLIFADEIKVANQTILRC